MQRLNAGLDFRGVNNLSTFLVCGCSDAQTGRMNSTGTVRLQTVYFAKQALLTIEDGPLNGITERFSANVNYTRRLSRAQARQMQLHYGARH